MDRCRNCGKKGRRRGGVFPGTTAVEHPGNVIQLPDGTKITTPGAVCVETPNAAK